MGRKGQITEQGNLQEVNFRSLGPAYLCHEARIRTLKKLCLSCRLTAMGQLSETTCLNILQGTLRQNFNQPHHCFQLTPVKPERGKRGNATDRGNARFGCWNEVWGWGGTWLFKPVVVDLVLVSAPSGSSPRSPGGTILFFCLFSLTKKPSWRSRL